MKKKIRFINSRYETLFYIPDGGAIEVILPKESLIMHCSYIDAYHARIGEEVYHICQFAELLERIGGMCSPEVMSLEQGGMVNQSFQCVAQMI